MEMEEMDLLQYWRVLLQRKWLIGFIFAFAVGAAVVVSNLMIPVYEASTTMIVRDQDSASLSALDPMAALLGGGSSSVQLQNYVQILQSRNLLRRVVADMGWEEMTPSELNALRRNITVTPVPGTEILQLSMESEDPEEAARFVNTMAEAFMTMNRESSRVALRTTREFLAEQLAVVASQLERAEERLRVYRETERVLEPMEETKVLLQQHANWERMLAEATVSKVEASQRMVQIRQQLELQDETIISSTSIQQNPLVSRYQSRLADLEVSLAGARERYTDRHPTVLGIEAEIREARARLAEEVERVIGTETESLNPIHRELYGQLIYLQVELVALDAREEAVYELRHQSDEYFSTLPRKELELVRLMRDAKVSEEIYIMLMKRNEEIRINEAMQTGNLQVVDEAVVPRGPVRPRLNLNVAIAGVLGVFIGTGLAFFLEYVDTSVKTKEQLGSLLDMPVLGEIPDLGTGRREASEQMSRHRRLRM